MIGRVYAILDKYENDTKKPMPTSLLKRFAGVSRSDLRQLERQGRLDIFYAVDGKGTRQKAYLRPKERDSGGDTQHETAQG